jgi:hypothetical protein
MAFGLGIRPIGVPNAECTVTELFSFGHTTCSGIVVVVGLRSVCVGPIPPKRCARLQVHGICCNHKSLCQLKCMQWLCVHSMTMSNTRNGTCLNPVKNYRYNGDIRDKPGVWGSWFDNHNCYSATALWEKAGFGWDSTGTFFNLHHHISYWVILASENLHPLKLKIHANRSRVILIGDLHLHPWV